MPVSYFVAWESPFAGESIWATLAIACRCDAKLLFTNQTESGIIISFDKEVSQEEIARLLFETIATEGFYTH